MAKQKKHGKSKEFLALQDLNRANEEGIAIIPKRFAEENVPFPKPLTKQMFTIQKNIEGLNQNAIGHWHYVQGVNTGALITLWHQLQNMGFVVSSVQDLPVQQQGDVAYVEPQVLVQEIKPFLTGEDLGKALDDVGWLPKCFREEGIAFPHELTPWLGVLEIYIGSVKNKTAGPFLKGANAAGAFLIWARLSGMGYTI